ncbi:N-6 DNA methylase [Pseudorhizobium sp. NPDC055634]
MLRPDCSLDQYFTIGSVSDHLVSLFDSPVASNILDLGAGGGSLAAAAVRRWSEASVTTVDIDHRVTNHLHASLQATATARHTHHVADALDADLPVMFQGRAFELAVCNPPYSRIPWRDGFARILSEAGLDDLHAIPREALTSDVLFLAQILRLARPGAEIGVIVPDGLVSGLRTRPIREALMRRTEIMRVVELPNGSFKGTEAKAHVVVLRNRPPSDRPILVGRLDKGAVGSMVRVRPTQAVERLDWTHYSVTVGRSRPTLRELGANVARGNLSSVEIKDAKGPVFHTTDFHAVADKMCRLAESEVFETRHVTASPGDILLARVDRKLQEKVCMVYSGSAALSDCIFRIRLPSELRSRVFDFLASPAGRDALQSTARGVGARMISKTALLDMRIDLDE